MDTTKRHQQLLDYLYYEKGWVSARRLAQLLNVSTRTIRNYVTAINQNEKLITSAKEGYILDSYKINSNEAMDPSVERIIYIAEVFLCNEEVDIFEVAEELHVSTSTIERELQMMREQAKHQQVMIHKNKFIVSLVGDEQHIRQILFVWLQQKIIHNHLLFSDDKVNDDYNKMKELINSNFDGLLINTFFLSSFIMHLLISVKRIQSGFELKNKEIPLYPKEKHAYFEKMKVRFESEFELTLSNYELYHLIEVVIDHMTISSNWKSWEGLITHDEQRIIKEVVGRIRTTYPFEVSEKYLFLFAFQVRQLVKKVYLGEVVDNPFVLDMKKQNSDYFELAVLSAKNINEVYNVHLQDEHITFLVLQYGLYLNDEKPKIPCILVIGNYLSMEDIFIASFKNSYGELMEIKEVVSNLKELSDEYKDKRVMIISTYRDPHLANFKFHALVSPILKQEDHYEINKVLHYYDQSKLKAVMKELIANSEVSYAGDVYLKDEEAYIDYLGKQAGLSIEDIKAVKKREQLSSTAFHSFVAIPHMFSSDLSKTKISFIINEVPTKWGEHSVKVIALVCPAKKELSRLPEYIKLISEYFMERPFIDYLIRGKSEVAFHQRLFDFEMYKRGYW